MPMREPEWAGVCRISEEGRSAETSDWSLPTRPGARWAMENKRGSRKCQHCGAPYSGDRRQRFCSRSCARYASPRGPRGHLENVEAFWARVRRGGSDECWVWGGARNSRGYGYVMFAGVGYTAHALAFRLSNPQVEDGCLRVGQECGNKLCCNPAHLHARLTKDAARQSATG